MVRELGPLWAHSCFFFEDVNGQVLKLIHGTQAVEEQVLRAVAILQKFSEAGEECFRPGTASKKLYDSLRNVVVSPEERSNFSKIAHGVYAVGSMKHGTRRSAR
ncbi:Hypp6634 [Branchiostoma lanceolatum]|uniref:Hypp6634 protein n=1 Tax=Branchiostoma lanceolatum TaxID=7740 RepID=A0A8J9YVA6_BRALA|nr:Hypp6634 [Branchiostoma lanceolatum]